MGRDTYETNLDDMYPGLRQKYTEEGSRPDSCNNIL